MARVTRLGEFSPIGRLLDLVWAVLRKLKKWPKKFLPTIFSGKYHLCNNFLLKKTSFVTFWATFLKTTTFGHTGCGGTCQLGI
jgi:hypothetical protein